MSDEVPDQYRPRQCHVVKWASFQGYGFNLHAEKGKAGQFIGTVDDNSPAEAAGLKEGDRIIEVNGINIGNENHQQVVTRIKSGGDETRLLVVDSETDEWYKKHKKIIRGDLPEVKFRSAKRDSDSINVYDEPSPPADHGHENNEHDKHSEHSQQPEPDIEDEIASATYAAPAYESASATPAAPAYESVSAYPTAPAYNGNGVSEDDSHRPRLCHLKLWPHFQGYGFNLHAEKDRPGQYIGLVDDNSPSSTAGLLVNDRIVEVNGVNIEQEKHSDVIARIKAIPGETRLLVVDKATDNYYKEKGITVSSSMPQTQHLVTPNAAVPEAVNGLKSSVQHTASEPEHEFTVAPHVRLEPAAAAASAPAPKSGDLELNLSVAEMKERLKSKKRQDPRMSKMPFEQKYKEFQRMWALGRTAEGRVLGQ